MIIGVDIGSTTTDAVVRAGETVHSCSVPSADPGVTANQITQRLASLSGIDPGMIDSIAATGVGSRFLPDLLEGRRVIRIDEFRAIAAGGLRLAGVKRALVVSIGTGTAIIAADPGRIEHFGGTGVGGGTLLGLAHRMLGTTVFDEIDALAKDGNLSHVDLRIGDLVGGSLGNLPPDATASNFGKPSDSWAPQDTALAIFNMIAESVGALSLAAARASGHDTVILVGKVLRSERFRERLARFDGLFGRSFRLLPDAGCAVALGALDLAANL
jgi:type II pantothenate kinase